MNAFSLQGLLEAAGKRMRADLAERLISHPGELGTDREEVIRAFLRSYLPSRFDVSTGFAFDVHGGVSNQLDIIISNSLVCPRFETAGGTRFYPCESIVAVGQVKSSLTTVDDFNNSMNNLASVRTLDRSANGKAIDQFYNEPLDHLENHLHQVFTFVLVTGRALARQTLHEHLQEYVLSTPPHLWPNVIFVLDNYLATFCCERGICPNPMDARGIAIQPNTNGDELLMKFYLLIGGAIEVTRVSGFPYWEYLKQVNSWSATIWHACDEGDFPPLLASITSG